MQASWGPSSTVQMSQECAELGTTSLLPSPPPNPSSPHMLAQALPSPHPLPLSTLLLSSIPVSIVLLVPCHSPAPSQTSEGVTEGRNPVPFCRPHELTMWGGGKWSLSGLGGESSEQMVHARS